jgi:hypothetical protein
MNGDNMSGGYFDYDQYQISTIADTVESLILKNDSIKPDEFGDFEDHQFSPETIEEFKKGLALLKQAYVYAQRIDWLASGDDSEDTFHQRLKNDLSKL